MLGGALIGLGLGSLISRGNGDNVANRTESGGSGDSGAEGESSGASGDDDRGQASSAAEVSSSPLSSVLFLGLFALLVYFVVRRIRRRSNQI